VSEEEQLKSANVELKVSDEPGAVEQTVSTPAAAASEPAGAAAAKSLHSLLHSMKKARCDAKWDSLPGTDDVRTCKACNAKIYRTQGMDDRTLSQLISANEPSTDKPQQRLFRRTDGTVMVNEGRCAYVGRACNITALVLNLGAFFLPGMLDAHKIGLFSITNIMLLAGCGALAAGAYWSDKKSNAFSWNASGCYLLFGGALGAGAVPLVMREMSPMMGSVPIGLTILCFLGSMICFIAGTVQRALRRGNAKKIELTTASPEEEADLSKARRGKRFTWFAGILAVVSMVAFYIYWDFSWYLDMMMAMSSRLASMKAQTAATGNQSAFDVPALQTLLAKSSGDRADYVRGLIAHADMLNGKKEEAKELYQTSIRNLDGKNINNQVLVWSRRSLATYWLAEKNYSEAEAECNRAMEELGKPNAAQGGIRVALGIYQPMSFMRSFVPDTKRELLAQLAEIKAAQGDTKGAESYFKQTLKPFPGEKFDYLSIFQQGVRPYVLFLKEHGQTAEAAKAVEQYESDCKKFVSPSYLGLAEDCAADLYAKLNDPRAEQALEARLKAEDAHPIGIFQVSARLKFAKHLVKIGKLGKAEQLFRRAIDISEEQQRELDTEAGGIGSSLGNSDLERSCEAYADFLFAQKKFSAAELNYRTALKSKPKDDGGPLGIRFDDSWKVAMKLANCLVAQNKLEDAVAVLERTESRLKLDELNDKEKFHFFQDYSKVMKAAGNANQSKFSEQMAKVLKADPDVAKPFEDYDAL
jgi:tetratricopeptide (TPR) repeat protein